MKLFELINERIIAAKSIFDLHEDGKFVKSGSIPF